MLRYFVQRAHGRSLITRPRLQINTPAHLTGVEQRRCVTLRMRPARQVFSCRRRSRPRSARVWRIHETRGHFVLSIGAGSTEVAVLALGGVVAGESLRLGGDDFDQAVVDYLIEHFDIRVARSPQSRSRSNSGPPFRLTV